MEVDTNNIENMDFELAKCILPMLQLYKEKAINYPMVADEDVPEHLQRGDKTVSQWDKDEFWQQRWHWVLDEMIYAFSKKNFEGEISNNYIPGGTYLFNELDRRANGFRLFGKYYEGFNF